MSERNYFFGGGVESSKFGFGGGGHDKFQDLGDRQDGVIVSGERVILRHEDVSAGTAAAFGFIVEASIGVSAEYHVTAALGCTLLFSVRNMFLPIYSNFSIPAVFLSIPVITAVICSQ